jgi:hypothetical protein
MATASCTATVIGAAPTLFTCPKVKKAKLKSVNIDNQSAASRTVSLEDTFTPDPSQTSPVPGAQAIIRRQWTVGTLLTVDIPSTELEGLEILGALKAFADATFATCRITVSYEFVP